MEKKKMKLWKKVLLVILALFVIFALLTLRKFIIITDILNKSEAYTSKTNYIATIYSIQNDSVTVLKSYNKDGNYLTHTQIYGIDILNERGITLYKNGDEKLGIIQSGEEKIAMKNDGFESSVKVIAVPDIENIMQRLQFAAMTRITTDYCNNIECYLIEIVDGWKMWVDKETGLMRREINGSIVAERSYRFDVVSDEDIVKPDI